MTREEIIGKNITLRRYEQCRGNLVVGTDYSNCVNFIVFVVRKLAVKCWLF